MHVSEMNAWGIYSRGHPGLQAHCAWLRCVGLQGSPKRVTRDRVGAELGAPALGRGWGT